MRFPGVFLHRPVNIMWTADRRVADTFMQAWYYLATYIRKLVRFGFSHCRVWSLLARVIPFRIYLTLMSVNCPLVAMVHSDNRYCKKEKLFWSILHCRIFLLAELSVFFKHKNCLFVWNSLYLWLEQPFCTGTCLLVDCHFHCALDILINPPQ